MADETKAYIGIADRVLEQIHWTLHVSKVFKQQW
jgi:hypothetical protein